MTNCYKYQLTNNHVKFDFSNMHINVKAEYLKRAHPFLSIGRCMVYVQEINYLNGYNCETFDEGCPNASYFSDETYLCKSNKCYLKLIDFCVIKCNFCIHKVKYIYKTLYRSFN